AHRHGLPVTAHAHGTPAIRHALDAGVDGMEHVTFWSAEGIDDPGELVDRLAERRVILGSTGGLVPNPDLPPPPPAVAARLPRIIMNFGGLYGAGAALAIGTDAGLSPIKPHDVLRHAVVQVEQIGIRPAEALRMATSTAAAVSGLERSKGRLAPGFDA